MAASRADPVKPTRPLANHGMYEDDYLAILQKWAFSFPAITLEGLVGPFAMKPTDISGYHLTRITPLIYGFVAAGQKQACVCRSAWRRAFIV